MNSSARALLVATCLAVGCAPVPRRPVAPVQIVAKVPVAVSVQVRVDAWAKLSKANFPAKATRLFFNVDFVTYDKANGFINDTLRSGYKLSEVNLAKELSAQFRSNYLRAAEMAERGQ